MDAAVEADVARHLDAGDREAAVTAALRGYGREIGNYIAAVLRDASLSDDAFAQFSENLWASIGSFRRESSMRTWCYRLAWHAAVDLHREPFRRRRDALATSQWSKVADELRPSTAMHLRTEVKDGVARLRARLDPSEQTLLILRVDRDLSWKDIAQIMTESGEPLGEAALRKRFERLTDKLRELARTEGLLPED